MEPEIEDILVKFLCREASAQELDRLELWLEIDDNYQIFKSYVKLNYAIDYNLLYWDSDKVLYIFDLQTKTNTKVFRFNTFTRYIGYAAAIFLIVFAIRGLFQVEPSTLKNPDVKEEVVALTPGETKAVLTLEDGSDVILAKGNTYNKNGVSSNGEELTYKEHNASSPKVEYNILTVPRGGEFYLQLSDGTKVWLNSDSQLKYPKHFTHGITRGVTLLYGEAYFEVSPSLKHEGSLFEVINDDRVVQVLGTQFNLKSYPNDTNSYTTLVEGKIRYRGLTQDFDMIPKEQIIFNKDTRATSKKIVNIYNVISWKDGVFSFEDKSLEEIMNVLSRWYDFDFKFTNPDVKNEKFVGVLSKDQSIKEILESIKNFGIINNYTIAEKSIILN